MKRAALLPSLSRRRTTRCFGKRCRYLWLPIRVLIPAFRRGIGRCPRSTSVGWVQEIPARPGLLWHTRRGEKGSHGYYGCHAADQRRSRRLLGHSILDHRASSPRLGHVSLFFQRNKGFLREALLEIRVILSAQGYRYASQVFQFPYLYIL